MFHLRTRPKRRNSKHVLQFQEYFPDPSGCIYTMNIVMFFVCSFINMYGDYTIGISVFVACILSIRVIWKTYITVFAFQTSHILFWVGRWRRTFNILFLTQCVNTSSWKYLWCQRCYVCYGVIRQLVGFVRSKVAVTSVTF